MNDKNFLSLTYWMHQIFKEISNFYGLKKSSWKINLVQINFDIILADGYLIEIIYIIPYMKGII